MTPDLDLGLALSGGGSRAAAFHRGTLRALGELGLTNRVKTISSVSGGSVFAAAWMAAKARGKTDDEFLAWSYELLQRGFIKPAVLHPRALKVLLPGYSRTNLLAATFDALLFKGLAWKDLPPEPLLCLNTAIMNNASSGRFSQSGYSGAGVGEPIIVGKRKRYPEGPVEGVTIGFATAASAAFPFGLPPLKLAATRFAHPLTGDIKDHDTLVLTDGGIIENLGVERLLNSEKFGTKHIVVSDAGVRDTPWRPTLLGRIKSAAIYALSAQTLERLLILMNDKQNKSMRAIAIGRLGNEPRESDRRILMVRVDQTWKDMVDNIPDWVNRDNLDERLAPARAIYDEHVRDDGALRANQVSTSFVGLCAKTLDVLEHHARWQLHFAAAVYGKPGS